MPVKTSAVDYMHNIFCGAIADYFQQLVVGSYLLNKAQWRLFQDTINSVVWPSTIGHLPKNVNLILSLCNSP